MKSVSHRLRLAGHQFNLRMQCTGFMQEAVTVLSMSLPLILSQIALIGIMLVDSMLMGRLGPSELAGGALALSAYYFCMVMAFGLSAACGNLVALAHGAGDQAKVEATTRATFATAILLALLIGSLLWHAEPAMLALGQDPAIASRAQHFLRIVCLALPFSMLFMILRSVASGVGRPGMIPFVTGSALCLSPVSGWILSQGIGSWPGLGLEGIAISTALTYGWMGLAFVVATRIDPVMKRYPLYRLPDRRDLQRIGPLLRQALPAIGTGIMENGMFSSAAFLMGALAAPALAAHQTLMQLVIFSFTIPIALTFGTSMCIGQAAGAGDMHRLAPLAAAGQLAALAWCVLTSLGLFLIPDTLIGLFLPEGKPGAEAARSIAMTLVPAATLLLSMDAWQTVLNGMLRALKDVHATLVIFAFSCWGVGMPLAWMLSRHAIGPAGVWWGMVTGLAVCTLLLGLRFRYLLGRLESGRRKIRA